MSDETKTAGQDGQQLSKEQTTENTNTQAADQAETDYKKLAEQYRAGNFALKEQIDKLKLQIESHGKEMQTKKAREKEALEKAGEVDKLKELYETEKTTLAQQLEEKTNAIKQYEDRFRSMKIMEAIRTSGKLNTELLPPEKIVSLMDVSTVQLDEAGQLQGLDDAITKLLDEVPTLAVDEKAAYSLGLQAVKGYGGGIRNEKVAEKVASKTRMTKSGAAKLLQNDKIKDYWSRTGILDGDGEDIDIFR